MSKKFIVIRKSPNWLTYDSEMSRQFCRENNFPETLIIEYIDIWDRILKVDYRQFRHALQAIAKENFSRVLNSETVSYQDMLDIDANDLVAFTDDDDWFAPDLFSNRGNVHGLKWSSIRIGRIFSADFAYGTEAPFSFRPPSSTIYTNTYYVTGQIIRVLGIDSLFEHTSADRAFYNKSFRPQETVNYLSCANKSPASALSALFLMSFRPFIESPEAEFLKLRDHIEMLETPNDFQWLRTPIEEYKKLIRETIPV